MTILVDAGFAQAAERLGRVGADVVAEQQRAAQDAVDRDEHAGRAFVGGPPQHVAAPGSRRSAPGDEGVAAERHPAAVDRALEPGARVFAYVRGHRERQPALARGADQGLGDHVLRDLIERGGEPQQVLAGDRAVALDRRQPGPPAGQRAGLVEQQDLAAGQRLERAAALDQDAVAGGARDAGDDRDRRRQDQRAGCGDHEHRERAHRIARGDPGGAGDRERQRHEQDRVAVGQPDERRFLGLRRLHQADDAGVGALLGGGAGPEIERVAGVERAAARPLAGLTRDRQRLAGQRRFVEHRGAAHDHAVDRHDLAGAHQQAIAGPDLGERDLDQRAVRVAVGIRRRSGEQAVQLAAGALLGEVLERAAARDHQRDHDARQHLAEHERARHRQHRDQVNPELAAREVADHRDQHHGQHRHRRARPDPIGGVRRAGEPDRGPAREAGCRHAEQRRVDPPGRLHAVSMRSWSRLCIGQSMSARQCPWRFPGPGQACEGWPRRR